MNYIIRLQQSGDFPYIPENQVYNMIFGSSLKIVLTSKKLFNMTPVLLTNLPNQKTQKIPYSQEITKKQIFSVNEIQQQFTVLNGKFQNEWSIDFKINMTGSLFLQIVFISNQDINKKEFIIQDFGKAQWMIVDPLLTGDIKNLRQLRIQSLLPKQIGENWKDFLKYQSEKLHYNAFHFPPLQQLGQSDSLYSIKNQHQLNPKLFKQSKDLKQIINYCNKDLKCISFVDILLNHTSYDSEWLLECDDSYFNLENTPLLNPAYILDQMLIQFSDDFVDEKITSYQKGNLIEDINDIKQIISLMKEKSETLEIENYYMFNIQKISDDFLQFYQQKYNKDLHKYQSQIENKNNYNIFSQDFDDILKEQLNKNITNQGHSIKGLSIDFEIIGKLVHENHNKFSIQLFQEILDKINQKQIQFVKECLDEAFQNIYGQIEYRFIKCESKQANKSNNRLVDQYFTVLKNNKVAANNGWILNANPTEDFVQSQNFNYLRRRIVIWTDLVKLRYGESKQESKFLWKYMRQYIKQMCQIFQGIRLDNAHSTPLHVGQYFMQKARQYNKQIIIFCELFTEQQSIKVLYSKKLGSNMLVQEAQKYNADKLGEIIHQLGEFQQNSIGKLNTKYMIINGIKFQKLLPSNLKEIIYDQTHDNESYLNTRTFMDQLPKMALLSFSNIMIGSTFGYDDMYAQKISVVAEDRVYNNQIDFIEDKQNHQQNLVTFNYQSNIDKISIIGSWDNWKYNSQLQKDFKNHYIKLDLNPGNYEYKFIKNENGNQNWVTDYEKPHNDNNNTIQIEQNSYSRFKNLHQSRAIFSQYHQKLCFKYPFLYLNDVKQNEILTITRQNSNQYKYITLISRLSSQYNLSPNINIDIKIIGKISKVKNIMFIGQEYELIKSENHFDYIKAQVNFESNLQRFADISYNQESDQTTIHFSYMPASLCVVVKSETQKIQQIENLNEQFKDIQQQLEVSMNDLNTSQINRIFYSSRFEEQEILSGIYHIPNQGDLPFAGLFGFKYYIDKACETNDLSLQIFENLRQGNWLLDYLHNRLPDCKLKILVQQTFDILKNIPRYLIPKYFTQFMQICQQIGEEKMLKQKNIQDQFQRNLTISAYQFIAEVPSAIMNDFKLTMAAGLPHFSSGYMRCWGRDTFISFKGILLIPGLLKEARDIILMFASSLRHGLIPNLLDKGVNPRYNCRDSSWWFIKSIDDYIQFSKDFKILNQEVQMLFQEQKMKLGNIVQEIFQCHAQGINFREKDAGFKIDSQMEYEGFDIELKLNLNNGFIYGGNDKNCLTWMDKMGSSVKAGNKGKPATSRNGAPIEMTCILKKCIDIVIQWNLKYEYPHKFVKIDKQQLLFTEWAQLIQNNFENYYFVPVESSLDQNYYINKQFVKRRGIYRDCIGSKNPRQDYQLRPNACIAYVLAPELFDKRNAALYFAFVEEILIEPQSIGLKTLDKISSEYSPYYDNSNDSDNFKIAHGYSYHNGPEWVWLYSYFVRGLFILNKDRSDYKKHQILGYFDNHQQDIQENEWLSLAEMTNSNGEKCVFSCESQAWSIGCTLEALYEIE